MPLRTWLWLGLTVIYYTATQHPLAFTAAGSGEQQQAEPASFTPSHLCNNCLEHEECAVSKDSPRIHKALSWAPAPSTKRNKGQLWSEYKLPATGS